MREETKWLLVSPFSRRSFNLHFLRFFSLLLVFFTPSVLIFLVYSTAAKQRGRYLSDVDAFCQNFAET